METSQTPERSKPTLPPKPAVLVHSLTSVTAPETSRSIGGDVSQNQSSSTSSATFISRNVDSPRSSGSSKPALLPKPEHLKDLKTPVLCKQTSPMIPKKPVDLKSPCISSAVNNSETVIASDTFKSDESPFFKKSFEDAIEFKQCSNESSSDLTVTSTSSQEELYSVEQHLVQKISKYFEKISSQCSVTETKSRNDVFEQSKTSHNVISLSHSTALHTSSVKHEVVSFSNGDCNADACNNSLENIKDELCENSVPSCNLMASTSNQSLNEDPQENNINLLTEEIDPNDGIHCISPPSDVSSDLESFQLVLNDVSVDHEKPLSESNLNVEDRVSFVSLSQHNGSVSDINVSKSSKASQSDVESVGSDTSGSMSVSRRLSMWFGSFGKGAKGRKMKRQSFTFYSDDGDEDSSIRENSDSLCQSDESSAKIDDPNKANKLCIPIITSSDKIEGNRSSMSDESLENEFLDPSVAAESKTPETEQEKRSRKAFLVAKELTTSEKVFINVLNLICNDFTAFVKKAAVDSSSPVIPEADLQKLIGSLPQLLSFNKFLLQDFENRINSWKKLPKIADVIVEKGPFLKLYTSYIKDFQSQCDFLDECCLKYPRFAKVLKDFEGSDVCKKLTLKHYMLKPVQRIPQYRLLLKDYLSNLDSESEDYIDTQQALDVVSDVANHANKSMKQGDHLSKLLQLQAQLDYEIVKPGREFIKEGDLQKLSRKSPQDRFLILLNDVLILTSYYASMTGLKVNHALPLSGMKVCVPQTEDSDQTEFKIITTKRSFLLRARTPTERQEWVEALESTIKENIRRQISFMNLNQVPINTTENGSEFAIGKEAPVWIPDSRVTMCHSCTAKFTVTFRRHHCRACGKVVCGDCSDFKAPLQYNKFEAGRVCEDCYNILIKEFDDPSKHEELFAAITKEFNLNSRDALLSKLKSILLSFKKKSLGGSKKTKKIQEIPQRLREVTAFDSGSQMNGWLKCQKQNRSWKRLWFVLKDRVLYFYKASEDVKALGSIAVLGFRVENVNEDLDVDDSKQVFQLVHPGRKPIIFCAENRDVAKRWIMKLNEATVLR